MTFRTFLDGIYHLCILISKLVQSLAIPECYSYTMKPRTTEGTV